MFTLLAGCQISEPSSFPEETSKREIVFYSNRDNNWDIYVMNADGSSQLRLTTDPAHDAIPHWSPDGKKIVFQSDRTGNWDLFLMNADGNSLQQLTSAKASDEWPSWSPDGKSILFSSDRDGNYELYCFDLEHSTQPTRVTENESNE